MEILIDHKIGIADLEVEIAPVVDAFSFRNEVRSVFYDDLLPGIEELFDQLNLSEQNLVVDRITLDVGELSLRKWKEELVEKVIQDLKKILGLLRTEAITIVGEATTQSNSYRSSANEINSLQSVMQIESSDGEALLWFYLENGYAPWNTPAGFSWKATLRELIQMHQGFIEKLENKLLKEKGELILERLHSLLEEREFEDLVEKKFKSIDPLFYNQVNIWKKSIVEYLNLKGINLSNKFYNDWNQAFSIILLYNVPELARKKIWLNLRETITDLSVSHRINLDLLIDQLKNNIVPQLSTWLKEVSIDIPEPRIKKIIEKTPTQKLDLLYIQNAGLVILHPFLEPFFQAVGLIDDSPEFLDDISKARAVWLTQYLVTGREEFEDPEMLLNKILCGFPVQKPIRVSGTLTNEEKNEAQEMLEQVRRYWAIGDQIVNSSIQELQNSFLCRPGKLTLLENQWKLQVEQRFYDLVLSSVPWNLSVIRTPFMENLLWVEWT